MKRLKTYLSEQNNETRIRQTVTRLLSKIDVLSQEIENEEDPITQNKLVSQQNIFCSRLVGIGIGFVIKDKVMLKRIQNLKI
jgi:CHASE3 domain sensor protein